MSFACYIVLEWATRNDKVHAEDNQCNDQSFIGNETMDKREKMLDQTEIMSESLTDSNVDREIIEIEDKCY